MNILISTLKEELETVKKMEVKYLSKIELLPKGSFFIRTVGQKNYGYLTRREGPKVKQEYLGLLNKKEISEFKEVVQKRRQYQQQLKSVREQIKFLQRALGEKSK